MQPIQDQIIYDTPQNYGYLEKKKLAWKDEKLWNNERQVCLYY